MPKGVYPHLHIKAKVYDSGLVARVEHLYRAGRTQAEIAETVKLSQKQIWRLMKNHGIGARVAAKRNQTGSANDSWRGDEASYAAFHKRVEAARGRPMQCEVCGTDEYDKTYDWANLTGNYHDVEDYKRMCRSCHRKYDKGRRTNARE